MGREALVSGLLLAALAGLYAQNSPAGASDANPSAPVGVSSGDPSTAGGTPALNDVDYPVNQAGILIQNSPWTELANQNPTKTKLARGWAASLSYGVVPAKIVAEFDGEHAATQVQIAQPIVCICHFISLPGAPVLVRLHAKKGARELDGGRMIVYPIVGGSGVADAKSTDLIAAEVSHPDSRVWLIRPNSPLDPGEYALMLGTQNMSIYPFTIAPPADRPGRTN